MCIRDRYVSEFINASVRTHAQRSGEADNHNIQTRELDNGVGTSYYTANLYYVVAYLRLFPDMNHNAPSYNWFSP